MWVEVSQHIPICLCVLSRQIEYGSHLLIKCHIHLLDVLASLKILQSGGGRVSSSLADLKSIQLSLINNGLDLTFVSNGSIKIV